MLEIGRLQAARPKEAFAEVGDVVRGTDIPQVVSDTIRPEGLVYGLRERRFTVLRDEQLQKLFCRGAAPFVFIEHPFVPSPPFRRRQPPTDTSCLVRRGATRIHLSQRERGASIEVWILAKRER